MAHSFRLAVIILVDNAASLSFDTQNERVITIGDAGIIGVTQAEDAKNHLRSALQIVLTDDYEPENLLTAVATAQSLDALAPSNPIASEIATLRELIEGNNSLLRGLTEGSFTPNEDFEALQDLITSLVGKRRISKAEVKGLMSMGTTDEFDTWVQGLVEKAPEYVSSTRPLPPGVRPGARPLPPGVRPLPPGARPRPTGRSGQSQKKTGD